MNAGQKNRLDRRTRERSAREARILKASREVFFAKGFRHATVGEIAERSGLAKGTLYLYFRGKEELFVSLMAEGMALLLAEMQQLRDQDAPGEQLVTMALGTYLEFYRSHPQYFRIMFLSSHPDVRARVSEPLLQKCMAISRDCLGIVSELVEKGMDRGDFTRADPWPIANILWSVVNGIIMSYEQDPLYENEISGRPLEELLAESMRLALFGLKTR